MNLCEVCDREQGPDDGQCQIQASFESKRRDGSDWNLRARKECEAHRVDWRARALAAESRILELTSPAPLDPATMAIVDAVLDRDALRLETDLAYQRGLAEGALERGATVEKEKAEWERRAVEAEKMLECWKENANGLAAEVLDLRNHRWREADVEKLEKLGRIRERTERATIERVAAWLDSHLGGGTCGLSIGEIASDFADELRSGAWKEPTP